VEDFHMKLTRTVTFSLEYDPDVETEDQFRNYSPEDIADMGQCVYQDTYEAGEDDLSRDDDAGLLESDEVESFDEFFAEDEDEDEEV
jgi:hypothetical protein